MTPLEKALDRDADCGDVLLQIAAVKGAMHGFMRKVMTGQLTEHVVSETDPSKRAGEATALIELLQRYSR
jgi:DNA-binding FrmR family transcriptional regulator